MIRKKDLKPLIKKIFTGPSIRSRLTRTFLPVIIAAVFIIDVLVRLLSSLIRINPALSRALIAAASAIIVGIIIAKLAKSIGVQIDKTHAELVKKDEELVKINELFTMIAENVNDVFWILDAKVENILYVSPAYERIWKRSIQHLLDNPLTFFDYIHPEDKELVHSVFLIQKTGKKTHIECRIITPGGSIRWIEGHGFPVKDASGQMINFAGIMKDITERKHAEETLRSERDFSDASLNSLPAIFGLVDFNTEKYLRWNKNFEIVTGYSAEEIKKLHPFDVVADPDKELLVKQMKLAFVDGVAFTEVNLVCKSGKHIPYYYTTRPINVNGSPCLISVGIDITNRKQAESEWICEKEAAQNYLDIAGVLLVVINIDMEVTLINRKASEVIGYEEEEIIGKNIIDCFVAPDMRSETMAFAKELLSKELDYAETIKHNNIILNKKGERRTIEWNSVLLRDDTGKITGILSSGEDVTERIEMQNMLTQAKNEWEETFDTINDAITIHDNNYNIIRANKTALDLLGTSLSNTKEFKCYQIYHGCDSPLPDCPCSNALKTGETAVYQMFEPKLSRHLEIKAIPRFDKYGQTIGMVHIARDISEKVKAEEKQHILQNQLMHMQKMESIGRLAGGVAHDFNNLLSGILGFCELALMEIPKDHPSRERIELILGLGEKAASLTNQLLAFSRKQLLVMKNIIINDVVANMAKMLKRIIGEDIVLELKPAKTVKNIMADQNQMEQVLLNLAVNARDAMPNGGILTIETANVSVNDSNVEQTEGIKLGEYIKLVVHDNGSGMDNNVLENIFEPFYTTKDLGKGTGLGLSTVYGIIKQHNGFIDVSSKINEGTTFNIYMPVADTDTQKVTDKDEEQAAGGSDTILVVDDEPILLSIIERALKPLGYRLLIAVTPEEALKINETYEGDIDLLLTDVVMPKMNGKELADIIASRRPAIKVVFMTGYLTETTAHHSSDKMKEFYLQKPIRINLLRQKLREVLDQNEK